jgi:hypothetical protein
MNETIKATLTADGSKFRSELDGAQARMAKFENAAVLAGKVIGGFLAGRALLNSVRSMAQEIDALGKTATKLQLPTADVQVLGVGRRGGGPCRFCSRPSGR